MYFQKVRWVCLALTVAFLMPEIRPAVALERSNLVLENIPEIPEAVMDRVLQYSAARSATFLSWNSTSDSILIATRFGEASQLHRVDTPSGFRNQLTFFREPVRYGAFRPGTEDIVFAKDAGGDEDYHLYYYAAASGEVRQLSADRGRNTSFLFSDDGKKLAWSRSEKGASDRNIWIADGEDLKNQRLIHSAEGSWSVADWSPDGARLILRHYISNTVTYLYVLDIETGKTTQINPSREDISYRTAAFSQDGRYIFYISDEGSEFLNLIRYHLASGKKRNLTENLDWDVTSFDLSRDGKKIAYTYNQEGAIWINLLSTSSDRVERKPVALPGVVTSFGFSPDSKSLAYTFASHDKPGNVIVYDLKDRKGVEWTFSEVGGLNLDNFITPELVSYQTFDRVGGDQREIPAWLYKPEGQGPHPVVVYIHGGPASQFQPRFYTSFQLWLREMGVAVVAPNVRGSAGYGKTYRELDNHRNREDSVKDIGALLDWIETQDDLDSSRVVVYGGSYGGYMVLASMVHYNDRLAGGIDSIGISNFVTFLENTRAYRRDLRRVEYGDERDPDMRAFLESISPANHADKITKPLFVIQGKNDPRVPYTEAIQMLDSIRAAGGDPWFLMANDEGHGFRKKTNRDFRSAAMIMFLMDVMDIKGAFE